MDNLNEKEKRDRCLRIADRKFDKPSAYKSGAVVRCRKGDIWKGIKEEEQLDESKQVGTIYHYTTFNSGLKILQSNQLKSGEAADSTKSNPVFAISFTRDKRFHDNHVVGFDESSFGNKPQLRFTIDGDKLSNRFSVQPYSQGGAFSKDRKGFEAEERVISDKIFTIPLSDYLISVDLLIEYKKPSKNSDWMDEINYEEYAPLRAEIVKFAQDKNIPINLIVNKNGDPWPDKAKKTIIQKILNWFRIKEADDPQLGKAAPYGSGYSKLKDIIREIIQEDESLHKWFKRQGPKGKEGGWIDCNAPDGKGGYKACGRKKDEKRSKYPACRPTPAGCKKKGKGKTWGKTKENMISLKNILTELESEKIYHIEGIILIDDQKRNIQDILSDIRSLPAITVVRNIDMPQDSTSKYYRSKLDIKVDPFPYVKQNKWEGEKTLLKIINDIKTTPGVVGFKQTEKSYSTDN
jgi:hypothetical protein